MGDFESKLKRTRKYQIYFDDLNSKFAEYQNDYRILEAQLKEEMNICNGKAYINQEKIS